MVAGNESDPKGSASADLSGISVAMATFNGLPYVKEQVESILAQSRPVQEVVICDDGSTDGTWDWLSSASAGDPRLRAYQNPQRLGSTKNFERAIGLCRGDVIFLSDQDDIWLPEKVERLTTALQAGRSALAMSNGQLVRQDGTDLGVTLWDANEIDSRIAEELQSESAFKLLMRSCYFTGSALCFEAPLKKILLPIPAGVWHDQWIALIATLAAPGRILLLDESLYRYRQHSGNQIGARLPTRGMLASSHTARITFLSRARQEVMSHWDVEMDVTFRSRAIQRLNWLMDHQPQTLTMPLAQCALGLLQRRLEHSLARCAFIEHRTPFRAAFNYRRRQAYAEFSRGWSTATRDLLSWLFYKARQKP